MKAIFLFIGLIIAQSAFAQIKDGNAQLKQGNFDEAKAAFESVIGGHTDRIGTVEYNQTLSKQRAQAVADKLVEYGVNSASNAVKGYGYSTPVCKENSEDCNRKNRRVEINWKN